VLRAEHTPTVVLIEGYHLIHDLLRSIPPPLRFLDFLGIAAPLDNEVENVKHIAEFKRTFPNARPSRIEVVE
jgi:hypothetical protein